MKLSRFLFPTLLVLALAGVARAQGPRPDFFNEVSLGGGVSFFTTPHGSEQKVDNTKASYFARINYHRYIADQWALGLDVSMTKWEADASATLTGLQNKPLGTADRLVVYGDRAISTLITANHVHWQYDEFYFQKSNFYYGVAGGLVFTKDNGPDIYSQYGGDAAPENTYLSQLNYERGMGFGVGVQAGFNIYFNDYLAFNAEVAPRFVQVYTKNHRMDFANSRFNTFQFPVSIGLSVRF